MLNNFSSIFEILAVLNLGYAGSQKFRDVVNENILRLKSTISENHKNKIKQLKTELKITLAEPIEGKWEEKIQKVERYFGFSIKRIESVERESSDFYKGMKSLFLITSLFCFFSLFIGGFDQFYNSVAINNTLAFMNLTSIPIIIIFFRNLVYKYRNSNVRPIYSILFFILPILIFIFFYKFVEYLFVPTFRTNIAISLVIGSSAFFLHFFRVFLHRIYFRYRLHSVYSNTGKELKKLERKLTFINQFDKGGVNDHSWIIRKLIQLGDFFINIWKAVRKEKASFK